MQTRPRTGRRSPPTATSRRSPPAPGTPSAYPAGRGRACALGGPGVAVGDAVAGGERLDQREPARSVIAGRSPGRCRRSTRRRVEAVGREPARGPGRSGARAQEGGRGVGEVAQPRAAGPPLGPGERLPEPRCCASLAGWSGSSAHARCDQRPVTATSPAARRRGRARQDGPQSARAAPPRESPVSTLSCTGRRPAGGRGGDLVELGDGVRGEVDVGARSAVGVVLVGDGQPAQQRALVARRAQREGLVEGRDPEPGRRRPPGRARRPAACRGRSRRP